MSFAEIFGGSKRKKKTAATALFEESNAFVKQTVDQTAKPPKQKRTREQQAPELKASKIVDVNERTVFVGNLSLAVKQLPKKLKRHFAKYVISDLS